MEVLIRFLLLLVLSGLLAYAEDSLLLNAHIRMIPKIMALDTDVLSHNPLGKAILAVVYDDNRKKNALKIAEEMNSYHDEKVGGLTFVAVALSVDELLSRHDIAFSYLTHMNAPSAVRSASWGIANSVPTFSYDVSDLEYGVLGSIVIERNTVIYINKKVLKAGKYRFNNALFQIARLIE